MNMLIFEEDLISFNNAQIVYLNQTEIFQDQFDLFDAFIQVATTTCNYIQNEPVLLKYLSSFSIFRCLFFIHFYLCIFNNIITTI